MEPRLIKGHIYKCKKSVIGKDRTVYYQKGNTYKCERDTPYPDNEYEPSAKHMVGVITNEFGNTGHCWPYDPAHHLWCNDRWTDYFEDLGEA